MFLAAVLFLGCSRQPELSKAEIEKRAAALGMGYRDQFLLFPANPSLSEPQTATDQQAKDAAAAQPLPTPSQQPDQSLKAVNGPTPAAAAERLVVIPPGATSEQVAAILKQAGAIKDEQLFVDRLYAKGLSSRLQAGNYHLQAGIADDDLIQRLVQGMLRASVRN